MIWIRIVSKGGAPASSLGLGVPLAASFGDSVGDIGRGVGCTLVLPDPNREISRKQALVTCQAGRHFIRAIGANLDIELNGRPLSPDVEMPLDAGADLRIGPYLMRVERGAGEGASPDARPASASAKSPPAGSPPQRPAAPPSRAATPPAKPAVFDDALKAPIVEPRPLEPIGRAKDAGRQPASPRAPAQPPVQHAAQQASPRQAQPSAPPQPAPKPAPPLAPQQTPPSRSAPQSADPRAAAKGAEARPADSALRPSPPSAPRGERPVAPPQKGERPGDGAKDRAAPLSPTPPAIAAANDDYVDALYGGLGMNAPPAHARSTDAVRLIGELLRESLAGTVELLAARQIAKKNLGASATMLQTRGNNPLKFSPNVDAALTHLLGPPLRGFIGPRDAVHDAFGDLRAHQVAMLAGMRAALEAVLQRFDPVALEARLAPKGVMDQLMPLNRRARLWETFGEQYASILREVEDDWDALFGRAFLQAYERQLAELARKPEN